jgi:hypothetical protein
MQLFDPLHDTIIRKLTIHKGISTQSLHKLVNEEMQISLPNFYKKIEYLIEHRIIMKENGKLFLHNRRVLGILDLADELRKTYDTEISNVSQLLEEQSIIHEANSIEDLDRVWADWELSVNKLYGQQQATFVYHSHPYYALGMYETEIPFFAQVAKIADLYYLCGNTKFLDQYGANLYKEAGAKETLASDDTPFLKEGYCITVVGDFVFEVLYPPEISGYFNIFFDTIKEMKDFNADLFHHIFEMKANCKLTVRRDKMQAEMTRKTFHEVYKKAERKKR